MVKLTGISKRYGERTVLKSVDLELMKQQTHVFLGSSGSGKSTLLKIILGLVFPDAGEVAIDGKLQTENRASLIGYVPQEGGLFPHLTAAENAGLVARTQKWSQEQVAARLEELRTLVSLDADLLHRYPKELSGGQRQRVAMMRAAFLNPPLMILDEPLGALDPIVRSEMQTELKRIFERLHKTVILVTHDLAEAAFFGHSITLLHEGNIVQKGEFQELLDRPATPFVTQFVNAQRTLQYMGGGA